MLKERRAVLKYHKDIHAIHPTIREGLRSGRNSLLVVVTDLALLGSPDHDPKKFADMRKWVERYRDQRYAGFEIEYRNN